MSRINLAIGIVRKSNSILFKKTNHSQLVLVQQQRNVRGVKRLFRKHLPKFRKDLGVLPPLTKFLTLQQETSNHQEITPQVTHQLREDLNNLRTMKLDTYKHYLPDRQKPILLEALFSTDNDIDQLLKIIHDNIDTMTSFYVALAFETLDDIMRYKQCDSATVMVAPEFRRLCMRALLKIRFFEADETLKLIKCLSTIGLPEDSLLSQAAFQMARHQINEFNLDELEMLSSCLEMISICDESKKSLLLALKEAIPMAKKNQIAEKLYTSQIEATHVVEFIPENNKQKDIN